MKVIIGLIALSFIVFFHELGHFVFAKLFKIKVLSFSLGMGPVLLHKTINGTDYRLSLFPFGGYCGLSGEKDFQKAIEENLDYIPKSPDSLYGINPLKRALIAFAGPLFNFVLAFICFVIISMVGYRYSSLTNKVIIPEAPQESPARDAGLMTGDRIIAINNVPILNFADIFDNVAPHPKETLKIDVNRNGQILSFNVTTLLNKDQGTGVIGVIGDYSEIQNFESPTYSFFPALLEGAKKTISTTSNTIKSISILFKGVDVTKVVSGPIGTTYMLGETVTQSFSSSFKFGLYSILTLIAFINISLGFMNLLPIPVLDGGLILFSFIELIFKKEISPKIQIKIQTIGLIIIVLIFLLGATGDIRYFIEKWSKK